MRPFSRLDTLYGGSISKLAFATPNFESNLAVPSSINDEEMKEKVFTRYRHSVVSIDKSLIDQISCGLTRDEKDAAKPLNMVPRGSILAEHLRLESISIDTIIGDEVKSTFFLLFDSIRKMLAFSFLKDSRFLLICFSRLFGDVSFQIPWTYIPSMMEVKDLENASFILSLLSITSVLSRLANGCILDRPNVSSFVISAISTSVAGLAMLFLPFCNNFEMFCVVGSVYGLFSGGYTMSQTIILVDILGIESLLSTLGISISLI